MPKPIERGKKLPLDKKTKKWFDDHRAFDIRCSVIQCTKCGLWYRPSLGHECEKKGE